MRRVILGFVFAAICQVGTARGQSWVDTLFPEVAHDFGTVARGSQLRYQFRLINTTSYDLHISTWRTKCGCTDVKVGAKDIPPGTQTVIEATVDTTRFQGHKASGLTLVFDRPGYAEKDLNMTCFIRTDVMVSPGAADFGSVARGSSPQLVLNLNYYGGRPDWGAVPPLHTVSSNVVAELKNLTRSGTGQAAYQLVVSLKPDAPVGYLKDEITINTNDPSAPTIPISVSANVQAAVTVAPAILNLGHVKAGQTVTRDVLVRASKPFKITGGSSSKPELTLGKAPEASAAFHRVTVSFVAPGTPGPFHATLDVSTDLADEPPAKLMTFATIVP